MIPREILKRAASDAYLSADPYVDAWDAILDAAGGVDSVPDEVYHAIETAMGGNHLVEWGRNPRPRDVVGDMFERAIEALDKITRAANPG